MFIRHKSIKGKPYAYLVQNKWSKKGARQKVSKYLGRIFIIEEQPEPDLPSNITPEEILKTLIEVETESLNNILDIHIENNLVRVNGNKAVISLNGGYLCDHTLRQLKKSLYVRSEEIPGLALAEAIARAGLRIPREAFIALYKHHQK